MEAKSDTLEVLFDDLSCIYKKLLSARDLLYEFHKPMPKKQREQCWAHVDSAIAIAQGTISFLDSARRSYSDSALETPSDPGKDHKERE